MERFIPNSEQEGENYQELLNVVRRLEALGDSAGLSKEEIESESQKLIKELLIHLESDLHLELSEDISTLYNEMMRENLLARVEKVESVIECMANDTPIPVGSQDNHYANSVSAQPEGLRIAMAEADSVGPVRLLVGLDLKALIGFKSDHLEVSEIADSDFDIRDTNLRKAMCRHVSGEIHREDLRYVVMRIPRSYFPQDSLSEAERKQESRFVFRGARIPVQSGNQAESMLQAA